MIEKLLKLLGTNLINPASIHNIAAVAAIGFFFSFLLNPHNKKVDDMGRIIDPCFSASLMAALFVLVSFSPVTPIGIGAFISVAIICYLIWSWKFIRLGQVTAFRLTTLTFFCVLTVSGVSWYLCGIVVVAIYFFVNLFLRRRRDSEK